MLSMFCLQQVKVQQRCESLSPLSETPAHLSLLLVKLIVNLVEFM